jgi:threonine synthase
MPKDTPRANIEESRMAGAEVVLVDGIISDAAGVAGEKARAEGWFDVSTFKEPYRVEGKKIMGYELAEGFGWTLPDVILYPTGGGTGLVGMWKAFDEMEQLGWIGRQRPRMVTVQSEGCAPMVKAFHEGREFAEPWPNAQTVADGLRVPAAVGDFLILRALQQSQGTALTVSDKEMMDAIGLLGRTQGMFTCPEGAAPVAALQHLRQRGWIGDDETVVLFNTGSGLKYTHLWTYRRIS